jgi:MATE family multidrug resistance protein
MAKGAIAVSVVLGAVVALVANGIAEPIVSVFGASGSVAELAIPYLQVRFLSLPALLLVMVGHGIYRGHQDTRTPLYVAVGMNLANLVLDPLLIFVLGMGVVGAAWATVAAQTIAAGAFLVLMFGRDKVRLGMGVRIQGVGSLDIGRILGAGWPMMLRSSALLFAITATTLAATRIGTQQVAAHQIALQTWLFMAFVLDSYAVAAMALIGTDIGSGDRAAAWNVANRLLALGLTTGVLLGAGLALVAPHLGGLFGVEPEVEADLRAIIGFVIVLQPVTAIVYVWDGVAIGASAFKFMASSMVVAASLTVVALLTIGETLIGVWIAITVLTVTRLVAFAGWHRWGPPSSGRDPSLGSQAVS